MSYKWIEMDSNSNAYLGDKIFINSTSSFTITMPANPTVGAGISFMDGVGLCGTNNTTINRNGKKIVGLDQDFTVETNNAAFDLIYQGTDYGWVIR